MGLLLWLTWLCAYKSLELVYVRAMEEFGALEYGNQNSMGGLAHAVLEENKNSIRTRTRDRLCHILTQNVTALPVSWELKWVWIQKTCYFSGNNFRVIEHWGHGMVTVDCSCLDLQWETAASETERDRKMCSLPRKRVWTSLKSQMGRIQINTGGA